MSTKHTPGPWSVRYDFVVQAQSFSDGRLVPVAQPYGVNTDGTDLFANARLIAAAPDLLEALEASLALIDLAIPFEGDVTRKARAALAKAKGEQG